MMCLRSLCLAVPIMVVSVHAPALAGAWPQEKGRAQLITSLEATTATSAYDGDGDLTIPLDVYSQTDATFYAQYGLTERLTLTGKTGYQSYETEFESFSGLASVELGVRYNLIQTPRSVFSIGASVEGLGDGRRDATDITGQAGTDAEARLLYGRNTQLFGYPAYLNVEWAYRQRSQAPDQTRLDATVGLKLNRGWMAMAQVFAGQTERTDDGYQGRWVNTQLSVAKSFGANTVQVGWRKMVSGRYVPDKNTLIVGLWRDF